MTKIRKHPRSFACTALLLLAVLLILLFIFYYKEEDIDLLIQKLQFWKKKEH